MFINNFDPVAIEILSFQIHWYSLAYIFGIILGWLYIKKFLLESLKLKILFEDLISYLILGIIIGGRLGYIIIYNPDYYFNNPLKIIAIWEGGMSFHGGVLGIIFANYLFSKKNNLNNFFFLDLISMVAPIGIFLGRIANFINSELIGRPTEFFINIIFIKIDNIPRHPSQIYEAIFEGIILFLLLNFIFKSKRVVPGIISSLFLIFYSLFRFFLEFLREPDEHLGLIMNYFSYGQIISIVFFVAGLIILKLKKNEKNTTRYLYK
tara:strand:- start:200 stop:994 length:795 start_codon:yes stop_codon:yes gene_type:complete